MPNQAWRFWKFLSSQKNISFHSWTEKKTFSVWSSKNDRQKNFYLNRLQWIECVHLLTCRRRCRKRPHFWYTLETARSSWLWRHANSCCRCCYLRWNRKEIFRLHASHIDYRLPFDVRCLELLRNNLPCGAVHQFLLAFLKRCVQYNTLHHIIYAVYAVMYLTFVLRFGEVKRTFVSQLSRTSTEISLQ